jgi:FMN phosphatase YigB (HAD superfamily)
MPRIVFLIDVDNTLLDNDRTKKELDSALRAELGDKLATCFWKIYEQVREEKGFVDIPLSLTRLREQTSPIEMDELTYQHVHSIFDHFPFQKVLYPHTIETLEYLRTIGTPVIVSDGDRDFQVEKIFTSSLADAVEGKVLIYTHKQEHLPEITHLYPADHYVLIDDKPYILADVKQALREKVTTVFVKQGKYAHVQLPGGFSPDISVEQIADLQRYKQEDFFPIHKEQNTDDTKKG